MSRIRHFSAMLKVLRSLVGILVVATAGSNSALAQVSVWASPTSINPGGSSTLAWYSGGLSPCTYNGSPFSTSGSATVSPASTTTYTLVCQGVSGSATVTVVIPPPPPIPSVITSLSPSSVYVGQTATLTWSSSNASSCNYGGTSGTTSIGPYSSPGTYAVTVTCTGSGGQGTSSQSIVVSPYPQPTMSFSVSPSTISLGGTTTWSWSSSNATSCSYSGTTFGPSGSLVGGPYTQAMSNQNYTASCTGPGGTVSSTAQLTVVAPPTVSISLAATEIYVNTGTTTASWSSTNATSCTLGSGGPSGSAAVGPYSSTGTKTVSITCSGSGGSKTETAQVSVVNPPPLPTVSLSLAATEIYVNTGTTTVSWTSANATSCTLGSGGPSGSAAVGPYSSTGAKSVSITCSGPGGSKTETVQLNVLAPMPTVSFSLSANEIYINTGTTTASWTSTDATGCTLGSGGNSGSVTVGPYSSSGTKTVSITCSGLGGSKTETAQINVVVPLQPPTVDLAISSNPVRTGESATMTINVGGGAATGCSSIGGDWSYLQAPYNPNGIQLPTNVVRQYTFGYTCSNSAGSDTDSIVFTVEYNDGATNPPIVDITLSANPVQLGASASLSITVNGVPGTCVASPASAWLGTFGLPVGASPPTAPLSYTANQIGQYALTYTCTNSKGSGSASSTLTVVAPMPTVSLSLASSEIYVSTGVTTANWTSTNATSCTLGSGGSSGTAPVGPYTTTGAKTVSITCSGPGGSTTETAQVSVVTPPPLPMVSLSLAATEFYVDTGTTTANWTSTNATSCTLGSGGTSGSAQVGPYTSIGTKAVSITCTGPGGSKTETAQVNVVDPPPLPTVSLSLAVTEIYINTGTTIANWTSTNATSCTLGSGGPSGSAQVGPYTSTGTKTVSITCSGPGGSRTETAQVNVVDPPLPPTVSFSLTSTEIYVDTGTTMANWTSTNATSCTLGSGGASGSAPVGPYSSTGTKTVSITCSGPGGSKTETAQLDVVTPPQPPVQLSAGFDGEYQARVLDFNSDGTNDIYISLNPTFAEIPGVEGFILLQEADGSFTLLKNLSAMQHSAGEMAPPISSEVTLNAADIDSDGVNDIYIKKPGLDSRINDQAEDVIVFASFTAGDPPDSLVLVDDDFRRFFGLINNWVADTSYVEKYLLSVPPLGYELQIEVHPVFGISPHVDWWPAWYLSFYSDLPAATEIGDAPEIDPLAPWIIFDEEATLDGCGVVYQCDYRMDSSLGRDTWFVQTTAVKYHINYHYTNSALLNQDAVSLIQPSLQNGLLRQIFDEGIVPGGSNANVLAEILERVFGGRVVFGGELESGTTTARYPWPGDVLPPVSDLPKMRAVRLFRLLNLIGALMAVEGIADNFIVYHYANQEKVTQISLAGGILPSSQSGGRIWFTSDLYPMGWAAKEALAMPSLPPVAFYVLPQSGLQLVQSPFGVEPWDFGDGYGLLMGGGDEKISYLPFIPLPSRPLKVQIPEGNQTAAKAWILATRLLNPF